MDINKRRFRRRSVLGAPASPGARASPFPSRMMGLRAALLASASRPRLARVPGSAFGSVTRRRLGAPPRRACGDGLVLELELQVRATARSGAGVEVP